VWLLNKLSEKQIEIVVGGDFAPINGSEKTAIEFPEKIWGDIIDIFKNADLSIVNLEVPFTDSIELIDKTGPNIKAPKECVNSLKAADINLVTLANNHIYDFGDKGVADTLEVCKENGIDTVGAGMNLELAQKIFYKEIKGLRIAIVNFAENEFNSAEVDHAGSNPMDMIDNVRQIRDAKENSDFVMVVVHGGHEYYSYPSPRMQKQYRFYAEEGASIVVGHHTHCVSGYETHYGVPIFYSLGNLFFPWEKKPDFWYEGMLLSLDISLSDKNIKFKLVPYFQCKEDKSIQVMSGIEKERFDKRTGELNNVISKKELLSKKWLNYVSGEGKNLAVSISFTSFLLFRILKKFKLLSIFRSRTYEKRVLNSLRCESHIELIMDSMRSFLKRR
jgi:poly-gamma-glutamate synthesis protein (capsule biosynthesis protein)